MAINKKLIHFDMTKQLFMSNANGLNNLTKPTNGIVGNIPYYSVVFLKDGYIWTHGHFINGTGIADSVSSNATISWSKITDKPSTFTPSAHTQAYTTLTGSGTIANQAIVSSGTANGWALKTLGSRAFDSTSYLPLAGGTMTGNILFSGDNTITWSRNTDSAKIHFKNTGDGDSDSYLGFETADNGNEYFRFGHSSGGYTEWMSIKSDGVRVKGTKVSLEGHNHNDLYVSSLTTSGNSLRWVKNGSNNDITIPYATNAGIATRSKFVHHSGISGAAYVSGDTHIMYLGYLEVGPYSNTTLMISSSFWGNQHNSVDLITIANDFYTNGDRLTQATVQRVMVGGSHERKFYYKKETNGNILRVHLTVYVEGGNGYGNWYISIPNSNNGDLWHTDGTKNYNNTGFSEIPFGGKVSYALNAGSSTKATKDGDGNIISSSYLKLSGGTMTGTPYISMPSSAATISDSQPFSITYGRIQGYSNIVIAADTDRSASEYAVITSGYDVANATKANGLAIGYNTLTWKNNTVWHAGNLTKVSQLTNDSGYITQQKKLANYYDSRPTTANIQLGDGSLRHFMATSSMTVGKPTIGDSNIIHLSWDNNGGWDKQIAVADGDNCHIQFRGQSNGTWRDWITVLDSSNSSVSKSGETLTVKINGTSQSLTNTWRGIQNNLTSSSTTDSLSAYQGHLLANGSARDNTKLPLAGGTMVGTVSASSDAYGGGGFHNGYANIILRGNTTTGTSGIVFSSSKGDTSINRPSDCAFIQYHPYGISTATAVGTNPTIGTSGEAGRFVIGIHNDFGDQLWLQTSAANDLKHVVGTNIYTIYDSGNLPAYPTKSSWNYDDKYVSSLTTNGNSLRWVKNGSNNDITIPYATNADTVDNLHAAEFYNENYGSKWIRLRIFNTETSWGNKWIKVAVFNCQNPGTFTASKIHGYFYKHNGNWEYAQTYKIPFQIIIDFTNDTAKFYYSVLGSTANLRLIKLGTRIYEFQVKEGSHTEFDIYYQIVNPKNVTGYTEITAGTTTYVSEIVPGQIESYGNYAYKSDTLDGYHASDFSLTSHNHDGRYLRDVGTVGTGSTLFDVNIDPGVGTITYDPIAANMGTAAEDNPNVTALNLGNAFARRKQLLFMWSNDNIYYRRHVDGWTAKVKLLHTGNISPSLDINGNTVRVTAGGVNSSYITVPYATNAGNATKATQDSDGNAINTTYLKRSGGTLSGTLLFSNNIGISGIMGGGSDGWGIVGTGEGDQGRLKIYVTDNGTSDWLDFEFRDWSGTTYTPLSMTGNQIIFNYNPTVNGHSLIHTGNIGSQSVASAAKLTTARTLWGQSFDGTANVSGAITGATTISASSNVSIGGTLGVTGTTTLKSTTTIEANTYISGETFFSAADAFRLNYGSYGVIHRNDGGSYWILLTDKNNQNGGFNSLRPFHIDLSTGTVYMDNNAIIDNLTFTQCNISMGGRVNATWGYDLNTNDYYGLYFKSKNSNSTGILFNDDGNVGIGTTSPLRKLHVIGEAIFGEAGYVASQGTGSNYSGTWVGTGFMELSAPNPYIDFHGNMSTADYTSRLIQWGDKVRLKYENSNSNGVYSGYVLTCEGNHHNPVILGIFDLKRSGPGSTIWTLDNICGPCVFTLANNWGSDVPFNSHTYWTIPTNLLRVEINGTLGANYTTKTTVKAASCIGTVMTRWVNNLPVVSNHSHEDVEGCSVECLCTDKAPGTNLYYDSNSPGKYIYITGARPWGYDDGSNGLAMDQFRQTGNLSYQRVRFVVYGWLE